MRFAPLPKVPQYFPPGRLDGCISIPKDFFLKNEFNDINNYEYVDLYDLTANDYLKLKINTYI